MVDVVIESRCAWTHGVCETGLENAFKVIYVTIPFIKGTTRAE